MNWCFAIVNGRLAEIFFEKKKDTPIINAHCYITEGEYKTKREKRQIKIDTSKYQFSYQNKKYRNKITRELVALGTFLRR